MFGEKLQMFSIPLFDCKAGWKECMLEEEEVEDLLVHQQTKHQGRNLLHYANVNARKMSKYYETLTKLSCKQVKIEKKELVNGGWQ
jgi:hypothetical protein